MTKTLGPSHVIKLAAALAVLGISACDGAPIDDIEGPPSTELGGFAARLLAHRSVDVDVYEVPGEAESAEAQKVGLFADHGVVRALSDACDSSEVAIAKGRSDCGTSTSLLVRSLCMGHWAQTIAETLSPVHMGKLGPASHFVTTGSERPKGPAYQGISDSVPLSIAYTVHPPSPSDRATWSLLATAMYARAVNEGQKALPFDCTTNEDTKSYLATQLADAVSSLDESMNSTLSRLAAATALRRGRAANASEALQHEWRGATDSRLESASLLTYIPPERWDRVPVFLTRSAQEGDLLVAGEDPAIPPGFSPPDLVPVGYVLRTPSETTEQLRTCRQNVTVGGSPRTVWITASATEAANNAVCSQADANWRVEGYLQRSSLAGTTPVYRRKRSDGVTYELVIGAGGTGQLLGYLYTQDTEGTWPVYPTGHVSPEIQIAEDLILTMRINPRQDGAQLATDLLSALNADYHGAYRDVGSAAELLERFDLAPHDLEDAANLILGKAELFGIPIVRDLAHQGGPSRYTLPEPRQLRAPHPAHLYAITQGSGLPYATIDGQRLETDPLQLTLPDVLARFVRRFKVAVTSANMPQAARDVLAQAASHAEQSVRGSVEVRTQETAAGVTRLIFSLKDVPAGTYEVWVGRAGLRCLSEGRFGSRRCNAGDFVTKSYFVAASNAVIAMASDLPPAAYGRAQALTTFPSEEPIYLVRRMPGRPPEVLYGVYPRASGQAQSNRRISEGPALTPWLAESLTAALAADPTDPTQALMSCSGLPTNVIPSRVKLEDELSSSVSREDGVDDSFEYYLAEARAAAQRADELGEQLLTQGLEMDQRAEAAVEELEQLCGGTVNVGLLRDYACSLDGAQRCDLTGLLNKQVADLPAALRSELGGVRNCLGIGPADAPKWVAVGDQTLCAWRYKDTSGKYDICTPCPDPGSCPDRCPLNPQPQDCAQALAKYPMVEPVVIDETLDLSVTQFDAAPVPSAVPAWLYARWLALDPSHGAVPMEELFERFTQGSSSDGGPFARAGVQLASTSALRRDWASEYRIRRLADSIGFSEDFEGRLKMTLNGATWFDVDRTYARTQNAQQEDDRWPCKAIDDDMARLCEPVVLDEMVRKGFKVPLMCNVCRGGGAGALKTRLKEAVRTLKRLTGAPSKNVFMRSAMSKIDAGELNLIADVTQQGQSEFGDYFEAYRHDKDRFDRCHDRQNLPGSAGFMWCETIERGTLTQPFDAGFLWSKGNCRSGDVSQAFESDGKKGFEDISQRGCGELAEFIEGRRRGISASWTTREFIGEPGQYCIEYTFLGRTFQDCYSSEGEARGALASIGGTTSGGRLVVENVRSESVDYGGQAIIDAFALAFAAEQVGGGTCATLWAEMPPVESVRDFSTVSKMITCSADDVERRLSQMFIPNLPADVIEDLQRREVRGYASTQRGLYGEAVSRLVATAQNMIRQHDVVVQQIRNLGNEFEIGRAKIEALDLSLESDNLEAYISTLREQNANSQIRIADLNSQISNLRTQQAVANQAVSCLTATYNALPTVSYGITGPSTSVSPGAILSAAATCANSVLQTNLEEAADKLQSQVGDELQIQSENDILIQQTIRSQIQIGMKVTEGDKRVVLLEMARLAAEKADALNEATIQLNETYAQLQTLVSELDRLRSQARRAVAKAMLLDNDDVGRQFSVNTAMRARMNSLRTRYQRARDAAIRAAYIARRALEQKLGVHLASMDQSVAGIAPPSEWVDDVCSLTALDPADLRATAGNDAAKTELLERLSQGTLVDYVERLAQLKDAYRNAFPFQDGQDEMVVSLRDELLSVREACEVEGINYLLETESMQRSPWRALCTQTHCPTALTADESPFACEAKGEAQMARCSAMGGAASIVLEVAPRPAADGDVIGQAARPQYFQAVEGQPGSYWLSWYEATRCGEPSTLVALAYETDAVRELVPAAGDCVNSSITPAVNFLSEPWIASGYSRRFVWIDARGPLSGIAFAPRANAQSVRTAPFAGAQLERIEALVSSTPSDFFPTGKNRFAPVGECEDTDGDKFRSPENWEYGCEYYCPAGASQECERWADRRQLPQRCFYETTFRISQADIEAGRLIHQAGFSAGNFNYRHNELAINLVGTGIRDCSGSSTPSSCHGGAFVQYTLHHDGPFRVRNFEGDNYYAPLYPGRIQQQKALTAERYLSNPLSSADQHLLSSFVQGQFRGRPLEGNYTLRIYDAPELDWSRLEDVQIFMRYRYWTRLE